MNLYTRSVNKNNYTLPHLERYYKVRNLNKRSIRARKSFLSINQYENDPVSLENWEEYDYRTDNIGKKLYYYVNPIYNLNAYHGLFSSMQDNAETPFFTIDRSLNYLATCDIWLYENYHGLIIRTIHI